MIRRTPTHVIAHLSDCHLRASGLVGGIVDADARLRRAIEVLASWDVRCDAWFFGGDLSDDGSVASYERLRSIVEPAASERGVQVLWGTGNHDDPDAFASVLWGEGLRQAQPTGSPESRRRQAQPADRSPSPSTSSGWAPSKAGHLNRTYDLRGLRVIALDSTASGRAEGLVSDATLGWLASQLESRAEHGTVVALHHPPLHVVQDAATLWPLTNPGALASVIEGSDVRLIVGGHFHQTSFTTLAGVPVAVAPSLAYTQDLTAGRTLRGQDAHAGFNLIEVHSDSVVVTGVQLDVAEGVHRALSPADVSALGDRS